MSAQSDAIGFGKNVLDRGGVLGLIALVAVCALVYLDYQGQQNSTIILSDIKLQMSNMNLTMTSNVEVLKDIRYGLLDKKGLTFRNNASSL